MDRNGNAYTFLFSSILVIVVGALLAFAAEGLKPFQKENMRIEKMQNILASVGIEVSADKAKDLFNKSIKEGYILDGNGAVKSTDMQAAFDVDVLKEYKAGLSVIYKKYKNDEGELRNQLVNFNEKGANYPLFIYTKEDQSKNYIIPVVGTGLWGPIWGYVAFGPDKNTCIGTTFDHKTETPGLGAEIKEDFFEKPWIGKQIYDGKGNYVSISVVKGGAKEGDNHGVDAISGGTITSNGVTEMVYRTLKLYDPYFKNS